MSTSNSRKISNVHLRVLQRCQKLAGKQNEKYFVLALRSAETFCTGLDPNKGNQHYGLTASEASALSESQFEQLFTLLLSFYALVHTESFTEGTNAETLTDTEKIVGGDDIRRLRNTSSVDSSSLPRGYCSTDYRAADIVDSIIGGRQRNLPQIRETLHYTAYRMLGMSIMKVAKGGCFVATAIYGGQDHPNVYDLQQFRDKYLLPTRAGRAFVHFYYRIGPTLARFISNRPVLHKLTKTFLDLTVAAIRPRA